MLLRCSPVPFYVLTLINSLWYVLTLFLNLYFMYSFYNHLMFLNCRFLITTIFFTNYVILWNWFLGFKRIIICSGSVSKYLTNIMCYWRKDGYINNTLFLFILWVKPKRAYQVYTLLKLFKITTRKICW